MTDWKAWAQRKVSRGGPAAVDPVERVQSQVPNAQSALPPAPPGMAWSFHPQAGYVLVQLAAPVVAPQRQPNGVYDARPFTAGSPSVVPGVVPQAPVKTCVLVKPGDRDTYADLLNTLPDLAPPSSYDATTGDVSPLVMKELSSLPEFRDYGPGADPTKPTAAFPEFGKGVPMVKSAALGSVALPPDPTAEQKAS